ncbi:MAG: MOP flippase family protein [Bacteroidetes bacterium]|nr:MOP flippase family protein [Bacteroidota bacterium]
MTLKQQTISGIKWTSISAIVLAAILFLQQVLLAHFFLTKDEFGAMAILLVIIGFANIFIDMGVSNAIIYKQDITNSQLSGLYWLNIFSGFIFFIIISSISPLIVMFYSKVQIHAHYIIIISLSFVITSVSRQFRILLQKNLLFKNISIIEITAAAISFAFCMYLAYIGKGIYSLIFSTVLNSLIQAIMLFIIGIKIHKPKFTYHHKELKEFFGFGRFQMGGNIINYFFTQIDTLLIGKFLGGDVLGLYTIAKTLVMAPIQLINPIITKVTFPVMSKMQDNALALKNIYLKTLNYLSSINFPIYTMLLILAQPVIIIVYGPKWVDATYILQVLSVTFLIRSTGNPVGALLYAKGRADLVFYWVLSLIFVIPVGIFIGSLWGINEVCYALLILQIVLHYPSYHFLIKKIIPVSFLDYNLNLAKPLLFSVIAGCLSFFWVFIVTDNYLKIAFVLATGGFIYACMNYFFNKNIIKALKEFK